LNIVNSIHAFHATKPTVVTIGTFDGVHIGHKKILKMLTATANKQQCESLVLTFFPHPRIVLQADTEMKQLNTLAEKIDLLESMGIDNLVIHPFDAAFSRLTAEEFVKQVLVETFQIKKIIIGYDHRFGRNRTANIDDLIQFGTKFGFEVEQISAKEINDVAISSTKIRNALTEGNIELANNYLGYQYLLTGVVVKGKQLGRTIDYPTVNLKIEENYKLIPKEGVYIVKSTIDGVTVFGMMNIGTRPTVDGTKQTIEVHYFDFNKDLYHQSITVSVLHWMRFEQKFDTIEALKNQLDKDKKTAAAYINTL
jgi:riboflavin kinase/FMN adenylyltransferase